MSDRASHPHDSAPPADKKLLIIAGILLAIPIIALMLVGTYARDEPRIAGFPFFIWYQFLWVVLCSAMTYTAYRLVLRARPHRPMEESDEIHDRPSDAADGTDPHEGGRR